MLKKIYWSLALVCILAAAGYAVLCRSLPRIPATMSSGAALDWPKPVSVSPGDWSVVKGSQAPPSTGTGPLAQRFRLAGTFFAFGDAGPGNGDFCKAILDDLEKKQQVLVREGDTIDDVQVARILRDRLVLRRQGREEELLLSFANALGDGGGIVKPAEAPQGQGETVLEVNRFGKRVGDARWVLSREALMKYYDELLEDPERLASLYVSMKPDYNGKAIAGYNVDIEGEKEFFAATGLQNGDVVRKVNSMNMISQARAEYFIGEFVKNRVSALVLDIDRGGQPKKLIYLIR